jgi:hypothetical protein
MAWSEEARKAAAEARAASSGKNMPLQGHPYHGKTNDELKFIQKDASVAARNMQSMGNSAAEGKYLDQVNDASTVLGFRARGGDDLSQSPATGVAQQHGIQTSQLSPRYNRDAVNNAIASSNRAGRRIGAGEASAIHALLKGRH